MIHTFKTILYNYLIFNYSTYFTIVIDIMCYFKYRMRLKTSNEYFLKTYFLRYFLKKYAKKID